MRPTKVTKYVVNTKQKKNMVTNQKYRTVSKKWSTRRFHYRRDQYQQLNHYRLKNHVDITDIQSGPEVASHRNLYVAS
jgi:hypothetical protein